MESALYKKVLARNFKKIRQAKKLTTTQIAEILGTSQAKVSYLENEKGILTTVEVALLSRSLGIPITEFFQGMGSERMGDESGSKTLIGHLIRYGAKILAQPKGVMDVALPFEDVFVQALDFLDDARIHYAFHAALIVHLTDHEIRHNRVFARIGGNPFLLNEALRELRLAIEVIRHYPRSAQRQIDPRASMRLEAFAEKTREVLRLGGWEGKETHESDRSLIGERLEKQMEKDREEGVETIVEFVVQCYHARWGLQHHPIMSGSPRRRGGLRAWE